MSTIYGKGIYKMGGLRYPVTIDRLAVGSSVYCNVNGTKTEFLVVNQGKPSSLYDDSCDGTWLLMKDVYENCKWSSGTTQLSSSTIHNYLNNTFLNLFDSTIRDVIKQVKIPYCTESGSSGTIRSGSNGLSTKAFLLSGYEIGLTTSDSECIPQDGAKLSYFESGSGASAQNKRIAKLNGSAAVWWLRSPDRVYNVSILNIRDKGWWGTIGPSKLYGVRPALVLPSTVLIDSKKNISI